MITAEELTQNLMKKYLTPKIEIQRFLDLIMHYRFSLGWTCVYNDFDETVMEFACSLFDKKFPSESIEVILKSTLSGYLEYVGNR